jgi:hypothetical protein
VGVRSSCSRRAPQCIPNAPGKCFLCPFPVPRRNILPASLPIRLSRPLHIFPSPIGTTRGRRHGTEKLISGPLHRNRGPCALPFLAPRLCHASDQQELLPGRPFTRPQVAAARSPSSTRSPDPFGQRITRRKKPSSQQLASHHFPHHRIPPINSNPRTERPSNSSGRGGEERD